MVVSLIHKLFFRLLSPQDDYAIIMISQLLTSIKEFEQKLDKY